MSWAWAAAGGALGAGAVLGALTYFKTRELQKRAEKLQDVSDVVRTDLERKIEDMREDLIDYGHTAARTIAMDSAREHLRDRYKLTERRIEQLKKLTDTYSA